MTTNASRRAFLQRGSALSLGVATPWALNLAALGEAAAQSATDYKALVCVFLYGGNDYGNTLVPADRRIAIGDGKPAGKVLRIVSLRSHACCRDCIRSNPHV